MSEEFNEADINLDEIDFSDLEEKYSVKQPTNLLSKYVIVDGAPIAPESKAPMLKKVLTKLFSQCGEVADMFLPTEDEKTKGYLIVEFKNAQSVDLAVKQLNGKKLDVKHRLLVNKLSDVEKYVLNNNNSSDEFVEPEIPPFQSHGYLKSWLQDPAGRDQFMLHHNDVVGVYWNKKQSDPEPVIEPRAHWTSAFMKFSPKGTYLFSMFPNGIQCWGGSDFQRIRRFIHPGVRLIDFSPNENYLVTLSPEPIVLPPDDHPARAEYPFGPENEGHKLVIWDLKTGLPARSFGLPPNLEKSNNMIWPLVKWSYDDKYCARMGPDALAIYDSSDDFQLLDKKLVKIEGIADFEFAPTGVRLSSTKKNDEPEHLLAYFTPELSSNQSAKASVMQIPSKNVIRTVNLIQVNNCKLHWQDQSKLLCVQVDRHTKSKKTVFTNLEIFQITEKGIPVENIELKELVLNFQWEPKGERFVCITDTDVTNDNISIPTNAINFFCPEESNKKSVTDLKHWHLVKKFEKKFCNVISFSPNGRFVIVGSIRKVNGELGFYDFDYDGEKEKDQAKFKFCHANVKSLFNHEYGGLTNIEWESSGRFVACWSSAWKHKAENGYRIYDMVGRLLRNELIDGFREFAWRPRPATLLTGGDKKKIRKNLKEFSAQFEEQDAMEADAEVRDQILAYRKLMDEWYSWREQIHEKLSSLNLTSHQDSKNDEVIEEIKEEILEEKEEIIE
ncbi:hypothetical protein B5S28_g3477 [[Candida] boidinii]|nr:hypothetical protein B5S28_g3477 [[Candida] boidinii]OWB63426.1 hypothetical protein B5S29_g4405 [[Candida] boidinii]OWB73706.1 hypothetical protein B5S31_g3463 [[Candida] boidinii]